MKTWDIEEDEQGMLNRPATEDQILAMWRASEGHTIRFARMLESFHGIGMILDCGGAQHAR